MKNVQTLQDQLVKVLPAIQRYARAYKFAGCDSEDLSQDVALKLMKLKMAPEHITASWLWAVVRNTAIDKWKKENHERQYFDCFRNPAGSNLVCERTYDRRFYVGSTSQRDVEPDLLPGIKRVLNELSKPLRQALVLHTEGYSYQEIAGMTGAALGTVRSRIHYARKRAQAGLAEYR